MIELAVADFGLNPTVYGPDIREAKEGFQDFDEEKHKAFLQGMRSSFFLYHDQAAAMKEYKQMDTRLAAVIDDKLKTLSIRRSVFYEGGAKKGGAKKGKPRTPSAYNRFIGAELKKGRTMAEANKLWKRRG